MMRAERKIYADNLVLEFKEREEALSSRRTIKVYTTGNPDSYKVINGLSAKNQLRDTTYVPHNQLKNVWIDAVVNGYVLVKNEVFEGGIKEVLELCAEDHAKLNADRGHNGGHPSHFLDSVHLTA
jgi:hypothetical protein